VHEDAGTRIRTATFSGCVKTQTDRSPALRDCFNVRTTLVGKSLFVFENKASVYRTLEAA